ncbi:hypothetical protein EYZ11_009607 [Aspergillus tanneri]|uniref:Uncharacterized protein n=1 Tax=Aspergillus tanneri TaxID=1220188 RepID=A0A4S3J7S0_9EURO|nr:hypothetical protein EYZ11_009607 [Aspergillus tanneri]
MPKFRFSQFRLSLTRISAAEKISEFLQELMPSLLIILHQYSPPHLRQNIAQSRVQG